MKKILITGATGLVGSHLIDSLISLNKYSVSIITRDKITAKKNLLLPIKIYQWDLKAGTVDTDAFKDQDIIIHLAGENVASRWNNKTKEEILKSRIDSSKLILSEVAKYPDQKTKIISAGAIGIYGDQGSKELEEDSPYSNTYLADVCKKWEDTFIECKNENIDSYILRIGVVLSTHGGALKKMLPIFRLNLGGPLGDGNQYMSWIHIDDLIRMFLERIEQESAVKVFNAVSPHPVTNREFTRTLGKTLRRLSILPAPKLAIKLLAGEMSEIVLISQNVIPKAFQDEGFEFKFPELENALKNILRFQVNGEGLLIENQWIEKPLVEVFDFFSEAKNLERITPEYLKFKVLGMNTPQIEKGSLIDYELKLRGIPFKWKTMISDFEKNVSFVDQQMKGPYKKWHHTHTFHDCNGGTLIRDRVVYKLPLGRLGRIFAGGYVRRDVIKIFSFRKSVIADYFQGLK
jgi:uncharacterized protein (TIGR01777 family)